MKRVFSLGPMLAVRVPKDVSEHAGLVIGAKVAGKVISGRIVYEPAAHGVTFRLKDFGLPIVPIPRECQRQLGLDVGSMVDVIVRRGRLVLVPAA